MVERARTGSEMAIVDLLDRNRTLGFAVVDDVQAPRFVLYAERRLSPDPNVRRRQEDAFSQLRYAIYLGVESDTALLGSSEQDLPLTGRRATTTIPYGDHQLVLVASPTGRLGDALTANLWWVVAVVGLLATAIAVAVLRHLNRRRAEAVTLAGEVAIKHEEQRSIAETLQLGLLPRLLAAPPHTDIASRYWPAGDAQLIGGDFWDVFAIDDRSLGAADRRHLWQGDRGRRTDRARATHRAHRVQVGGRADRRAPRRARRDDRAPTAHVLHGVLHDLPARRPGPGRRRDRGQPRRAPATPARARERRPPGRGVRHGARHGPAVAVRGADPGRGGRHVGAVHRRPDRCPW